MHFTGTHASQFPLKPSSSSYAGVYLLLRAPHECSSEPLDGDRIYDPHDIYCVTRTKQARQVAPGAASNSQRNSHHATSHTQRATRSTQSHTQHTTTQRQQRQHTRRPQPHSHTHIQPHTSPDTHKPPTPYPQAHPHAHPHPANQPGARAPTAHAAKAAEQRNSGRDVHCMQPSLKRARMQAGGLARSLPMVGARSAAVLWRAHVSAVAAVHVYAVRCVRAPLCAS